MTSQSPLNSAGSRVGPVHDLLLANNEGLPRRRLTVACQDWVTNYECKQGNHCGLDHPPVDAIFIEGPLSKKGSRGLRLWNRRFFVATPSGISYAHMAPHLQNVRASFYYKKSVMPEDLFEKTRKSYSYQQIRSIEPDDGKKFHINFLTGETWYLEASDLVWKERWLSVLGKCLQSLDPRPVVAAPSPIKHCLTCTQAATSDEGYCGVCATEAEKFQSQWWNPGLGNKHAKNRTSLEWLFVVLRVLSIVIFMVLVLSASRPYFRLYEDLEYFADKATHFHQPIHIPYDHNLSATQQSILNWQSEFLRLRSEVTRFTALRDSDADSSHLEFQQDEDLQVHDDVWDWHWLSWLLLASFFLDTSMHISEDLVVGTISVTVNAFLLLLLARAKGCNDALADNVQRLHGAALEIVSLSAGEDNMMSYSLCIQKLEMFTEFWNSRSLGVTIMMPFAGGITANAFLLFSLVLANEVEILRLVARQLRHASTHVRSGALLFAVVLLLYLSFLAMREHGLTCIERRSEEQHWAHPVCAAARIQAAALAMNATPEDFST